MYRSKLTAKLINVCAWCGKEQYGVFDESASITHGICEECLDALQQNKDTLLLEDTL